ncbi:hypothetical protein FRZ06_10190 [Anoxybacterium hadale]|uniref:Uncharacterized protein n=1 Tax=Anoxybacterium hadale TaxID=3408580 RepID=A0ACD1ABH5_9FIRM|nr:hypothetical protein FRZ06_10190 [Clostridiales bacterium]
MIGREDELNQRAEYKELALAAAREAILELTAQDKASAKKQVFQNTNLLLEHYLDLKAYCIHAVYKEFPINLEDAVNLEGYEITIQSIKANLDVTRIILSHVNTALALLKKKCRARGFDQKFRVIELMHLDEKMQAVSWPERVRIISEELQCEEASVLKWRNEMVRDLGVFLFGAGGLKLGWQSPYSVMQNR